MRFTACIYHTKLVTKLKVHVRCVKCDLLDYLDAMCWLTNETFAVGLLHNISVDSDKMN